MTRNLLDEIKDTLLMGPGPSCVSPEVYKALSRNTIGHLNPHFIKIMDEVKVLLQKLMNTSNKLTLPICGTGTAGMELCLTNLIEPKDKILILANGVFGMRMWQVANRIGAQVDNMNFKWGTPIKPDAVKEKLENNSYKIVAMVHAETSTGVENPINEISKLVKNTDSLFLVDMVSSLGGLEVKIDDWGIDAAFSGSQKCISVPPGLSPVSFSDRAFSIISHRKTKIYNFCLNMKEIGQYWTGERERIYHHTAPVNMLYGFYQGLCLIIEEGLENVYKRHVDTHIRLTKGLEGLGLEMFVEKEYRLPMVNSVSIPKGTNDLMVRQTLLNEHGIEIGAGIGPLSGKIWRIGLMGHTARSENVDRLLKSLNKILK